MLPPPIGREHEKECLSLEASLAWRRRRLSKEVVHRCCCGLDMHKESVTACVIWAEKKGKKRREKRRYGTFTQALVRLSDWLLACGVLHVAIESTGAYWKPVWHILERQFELLLVNAQQVKAILERRADQCDAAWLAELIEHA